MTASPFTVEKVTRRLLIVAATLVALTVAANAKATTFYTRNVDGWAVVGQSWEESFESICFATKSFGDVVVTFEMLPGDPNSKIRLKSGKIEGVEVPMVKLSSALKACQWQFEKTHNE